ncbi:MAG: proline dehydrogenase family protein [Actinomycetota bacterium]
MFRSVVLGVANRRFVRRAVTGGIGRKVALRFVAGEDLDHAIDAIRTISQTHMTVTLDHLGENVTEIEQAKAAAGVYLAALDRIAAEQLPSGISVKLTQLGLDVDPGQAFDLVQGVVARAAEAKIAVTLDMEDHNYTERTVEIALRLGRSYPGAVGVAVQSYLHRTPADLERLVDAKVQIRLCKGAYREPRAIAFRRRSEVDAAFARLANRLITSPSYAMIATHDDRLVDHVLRQVARTKREPGTYEFQMLYGIRRELQRRLVAQGEKVRVYVPFGSQWYPYLMRLIAERPSNIKFFAEALLRA